MLGLQAVWLSWLIWRSSFVDAGQRIFCLADDAMISMTYARNLVEGFGLNWARFGAPVEGFTHPVWLAGMVAVNLLPLPLEWRSLLVQIAALPMMALLAVAIRRLMSRHFSMDADGPGWIAAAIGAGFYYPLAHWAVLGMETALQAVLVVLAVGLTFDITERDEERHLALWLVLACAFSLRMDMAILAICCQGYLAWRLRRRVWVAGWRRGGIWFLAIAAAYQMFRIAYFGDALPNTYYLKLSGIPLDIRSVRGLRSLGEFAREHAVLLSAAAAALLALGAWRRRGLLLAGILLAFAAYDVYVGGDVWDFTMPVRANRFVAFVVPLSCVLVAAAVNRLRAQAEAAATGKRLSVVATALFLLVAGNGLIAAPAVAARNLRALTGLDQPGFTGGHAAIFRSLRSFQEGVPAGSRVATFWAGIPQYFGDYRGIDILGYNERVTAHGPPIALTTTNFWPGHVKFDALRVLRMRPDAYFQTLGWTPAEEAALLPAHGYVRWREFWVRADRGLSLGP